MPVGQTSGGSGVLTGHSSGGRSIPVSAGTVIPRGTSGGPRPGWMVGQSGGASRLGSTTAVVPRARTSSGARAGFAGPRSGGATRLHHGTSVVPQTGTSVVSRGPGTSIVPRTAAATASAAVPRASGGMLNNAWKYAKGNPGKMAVGAGAAFFAGNRMSSGRGSTPGSQSLYG